MAAVAQIAEERAAERDSSEPDLVGPPCHRPELDERGLIAVLRLV